MNELIGLTLVILLIVLLPTMNKWASRGPNASQRKGTKASTWVVLAGLLGCLIIPFIFWPVYVPLVVLTAFVAHLATK